MRLVGQLAQLGFALAFGDGDRVPRRRGRPRRLAMDRTRPLSTNDLHRLEERLRADGAQPLNGARQGLSVAAIAEHSADLVGDLPAEAQLWWSWRTWGPGSVLPAVQYVTLQDALNERTSRRREGTRLSGSFPDAGMQPDDFWHPGWLPIFAIDGGTVLVTDCGDSDGQCAPIRLIDWQDLGSGHFARAIARSLGDYVRDALDSIDTGEWTYDAARRDWRRERSS